MSETVLVLGGGVAGMTTAHELAERGFSVTVLEGRHIPGGKARSLPVPHTGRDGRQHLPAEHGFRFFPGFYRHVPDTMQRIPYRDQAQGVLGNLRQATQAEIAQSGGRPIMRMPAHFPRSPADILEMLHNVFQAGWGLSAGDLAHFAQRLLVLLTSCEERRFAEWENQSWWEFTAADRRSPAYQSFLADGMTRTLVAAQAKEMSARTGGYILLQLLFDLGVPGRAVDRVLHGPTNDVWIGPWLEHLQAMDVIYEMGTKVEALACSGNRITGVTVSTAGEHRVVHADWYVAALPVEHMVKLASTEMKEAEPRLAQLDKLVTRWMNGILFYLRQDVPITFGHVIYIDAPWSLTSISQRQFWENVDFLDLGAGDLGGILSVDISDWNKPGILYGKPAMQCTRQEIHDEVWAQLKAALNRGHPPLLADENLIRSFLDDDVRFPEVRHHHGIRTDINLEPLLVNTKGSWQNRPETTTAIENFFLAGDYVRTHTDLATMEGANESGRRAANAILEATGSSAAKAPVWPLHEPAIFAPARLFDSFRFRLGQSHVLGAGLTPAGVTSP